jgi:transposase
MVKWGSGRSRVPVNFLHESGGERTAAMYSLIGSARLNGLDPEAYLAYVLERIADHPSNRIDDLLPWSVTPALPAGARVNAIH